MRRSKEKSQAPLISAPGFGMLFRSDMQQYRSGHNGADSKSVWSNPRGFESHLLRQKRKSPCRKTRAFSFLMGDSNPERVSGVQKTVRWTVFSREVRSGYAARTDDARRSRRGIIPPAAPEKPTSFNLSVFQLNPPFRVGEILLRNVKYACGV